MNFMAAIGPDFKAGFVDELPVSNADVGKTIDRIMGWNIEAKGRFVGRVMREAMPGGRSQKVATHAISSPAAGNGLRTVLHYQSVATTHYFDVAGFLGRTVGLSENGKSASR